MRLSMNYPRVAVGFGVNSGRRIHWKSGVRISCFTQRKIRSKEKLFALSLFNAQHTYHFRHCNDGG